MFPLTRLALGISVEYWDWLDVRASVPRHVHFPVPEMHLFSDRDDHVERAIGMLGHRGLASVEHTSTRPLEDGFLSMLELTDEMSTIDVEQGAVRAWFARERASDATVEKHLRACYGAFPQGERPPFPLRYMDYPVFDNGTACVHFGLMIDFDRTKWLWSRVAFAHK